MRLISSLLLAAAPLAAHADVLRYEGMPLSRTVTLNYNGRNMGVHAGQMNISLDGEAGAAFCVDLDHNISSGRTYLADPVAAEAESPWCGINYILGNFSASSADLSAAMQVAIWELKYGAALAPVGGVVGTIAAGMLDAAEGQCPLFCNDEPVWDVIGTFNADGTLTVQVTLGRDGGPAVAGEQLLATPSSGTLLAPASSVATTDLDGQATFVVDVRDADLPLTLDIATVGREVVRLVAVPANAQQELVSVIGECSFDPQFAFDAGAFGDPHTIGFWKHQVEVALTGRGHAQVDAETLAGYLPISLFGETVDSLETLHEVLWLKKASMEQRALQQCLALHLNVAAGEAGWATDVTIGGETQRMFAWWADAQAALAAGDAETAKTICDDFNNL
ncbi:MAG: hypothetical protein H6706_05205 [Myxococcales bacterium]|nr:hypothetical protein [Myxococcales bacterium]